MGLDYYSASQASGCETVVVGGGIGVNSQNATVQPFAWIAFRCE